MSESTPLYLLAPDVLAGDILPDASRFAVATVTTIPYEGTRVTFAGTSFTRYYPHGGPDYGFPAVRIERPRP